MCDESSQGQSVSISGINLDTHIGLFYLLDTNLELV